MLTSFLLSQITNLSHILVVKFSVTTSGFNICDVFFFFMGGVSSLQRVGDINAEFHRVQMCGLSCSTAAGVHTNHSVVQ